MSTKRIFVSCGQRTTEEKTVGQEIRELIRKHDMDGFFAEEVHDALDLNTSLFRELQNCDGFVSVLQNRGEVHYPGFEMKRRASVWIHQEIAILFYRSFLLKEPIPMRIYVENGLLHEGLTQFSIINPIPFEYKNTIFTDLSSWLGGSVFDQPPVLARRENLFRRRIEQYKDHHWLILEIIAAHSRNPGDSTRHTTVLNDFRAVLSEEGRQDEEINRLHGEGLQRLLEDSLIVRTENIQTASFYIGTQWWDLIIEELRNRARLK